ncbi:hypothetical protein [uncultured Fibrella sp.]|uniref:hypothetical protein n=1 Tax=uncultured Fibrella sp. TaxID=1284596 RepID=UPI0035CC2B49
MKRTFHPDLRELLTSYELRMSLSVTANRVVRWRKRAQQFRRWPRLLRLAAGGSFTQLLIDLVADVAESDYLEEVMAWENPLSGEM